ncbi:MAG TPA: ribonuclease III [Deltaproteobacteria bacterium]|jgi:ribonuclease-3|nr:ribonuclease III [Deltaproteobacteria bacterium]
MARAEEAFRTELEAALGHHFNDATLLERALTHPSFANETGLGESNERLEFLGDAVLGLVVAHLLYEAHPEWTEGELTRARHALVNMRALAHLARALSLGKHVRLGRSEQRTGGAEKDSILSDLFEALVGAIYLDAGTRPVEALVRTRFEVALKAGSPPPERDPKTQLQEWAQARFHCIPTYHDIADSGVENDEGRFAVEVRVAERPLGQGVGRTKRQAEREAALAALREGGCPLG